MKKFIRIVIVLIGIGVVFWWIQNTLPINSQDKSQTIFAVSKGSGIRQIAQKLKNANLIRDQLVFYLLVREMGLENCIQAGDFRLSPSMSSGDIAKTLTHGALDIWVTIPEGKRADEISDILKEKIPTYNETWRQRLDANEGYLFPDTYLIPRDSSIDNIITVMRNNFTGKYQSLTLQQTSPFPKNNIVVLASIIEREGRSANDMPLVSSVLYNRLNAGMPLQVDASIQYALGYQQDKNTWWKKDLTTNDLKMVSLYNTYTHTGLPPTPISNPGTTALLAAMHPVQSNYLYYISDKQGTLHFAKTLEEHNANIKKYGL